MRAPEGPPPKPVERKPNLAQMLSVGKRVHYYVPGALLAACGVDSEYRYRNGIAVLVTCKKCLRSEAWRFGT